MKNLSSSFNKLVAMAACALTLASCSRSEYAMLPKGPSYYGSTRIATPAPVVESPAVAVAPVAQSVPAVVAQASVVAPKKAAVTAPVAKAAPVVATAPAAVVAAAPAPKLNVLQRVALSKVARKVEKLTQKSGSARQHSETAATQKISGKLRQGLILILIGLLVEILASVIGSSLVYLLGAIIILIGVVLIVMYLLDEL